LVDKNGQVRKYYDGLENKEIKELAEDIPALLKEPATQKRFVNNLFTN
jgi:cytochrome oxidase Cu insertion factor (SCO1/SenC/PrrC family)